MMTPTIQPDEFGPGYMIRFALANGRDSPKLASEMIIEAHPEAARHPRLYSYHLSLILELSIEEYVQRHTLLPVTRCITAKNTHLQHGSLAYENGVFWPGHMNHPGAFNVCNACIKEDLDYLGFTFYRKSHQLPGLNYCLKHGNNDIGALYSTPNNVFCNPHQIKKTALNRLPYFENEVVSRYHVLVDEVNQIKFPINPNPFVIELRKRIARIGLTYSTFVKKKRVSSYLTELLPEIWLNGMVRISEGASFKDPFVCFDQMLASSKQITNPTNYLILMAALFENTDEALSLLTDLSKIQTNQIQEGMAVDI